MPSSRPRAPTPPQGRAARAPRARTRAADAVPVPGAQRPGGRTARVREQVLEATRDELLASGFGAVTIERIAQRAGVGKTTVYRRWRTVEGLVRELLSDTGRRAIPFDDTGSVAGDLRLFAQGVIRVCETPATFEMLKVLVAAALRCEESAATLRTLFAERIAAANVMIDRAKARGELDRRVDGSQVIRFVAAPIYYRVFVSKEPLHATLADECAAAGIAAARAGVFNTRR